MLRTWPLWVAALWWGSLSAVGFWVVPLLFKHLPSPAMAGAMAAQLFTAQTWVALVCGWLLLLAARGKQDADQPQTLATAAKSALMFIAAGMLLAALSEFVVAPRIIARENLKFWHAVGSGMYLLQWVCAGLTLQRLFKARG